MRCKLCGHAMLNNDPYLETKNGDPAHFECIEDAIYELIESRLADRICNSLWDERQIWEEDEAEEVEPKYDMYDDDRYNDVRWANRALA